MLAEMKHWKKWKILFSSKQIEKVKELNAFDRVKRGK